VSGSVFSIRQVKEAINQGLPVEYSTMDIHSVAGIVQTWLRELPDPLLTWELQPEWMQHAAALDVDRIRTTIAKLPQHNRFLLQYLCQFLHRVASFGMVNKMKSSNLAIVFGPSLLSGRDANAMNTLQDVCTLVQFLIDNHQPIFEGVEEERISFRKKLTQEKVVKQQEMEHARLEARRQSKRNAGTRSAQKLS